MEVAHFVALSPDVGPAGARKARKCTVDIILPQHCYMGSICSGIAQYPHSHLLSYPNFGSVCPRQLSRTEIGVDKPSMGTDCQSGVPGLWLQKQQGDLK